MKVDSWELTTGKHRNQFPTTLAPGLKIFETSSTALLSTMGGRLLVVLILSVQRPLSHLDSSTFIHSSMATVDYTGG
jgi:hypothetical protein